MKKIFERIFSIVSVRVLIGFIFLWAFLDKTIGLGLATKPESAWINGGSPTYGFLTYGTKGPFASFFQNLAGNASIDWVFMLGLLFVGIALIINKYTRLGALAGLLMLVLMYLAALWPENNPIVDEHIVYAVFLGYIAINAKK